MAKENPWRSYHYDPPPFSLIGYDDVIELHRLGDLPWNGPWRGKRRDIPAALNVVGLSWRLSQPDRTEGGDAEDE